MPTILLTGANRGIGLELTRQYAEDGWVVHACCRNPGTADDLNHLQSQYPDNIAIYALDVTDADQRNKLAKQLEETPIDILFNNAGIYGDIQHQQFGNSFAYVWQKTFETNVIAPMQMMETFKPQVAASELKLMANMSSKMGSIADNGSGGSYVYRSCKAALNAVCVSAAKDLADEGIQVAILHPGWVRTDMGGPNGELSVQESAAALRNTLANFTPDDSGRFIDIDGSTIPW
jgi:NAD(P)-dependent dehydrogenase (short-subunit alcohol dehydrogenase family)